MAASTVAERAPLPLLARPTSVLLLVSLAHAVTHIYAALFPLIYPIIQREWAIPYVVLGTMIGVTNFTSGVLQLAFGFIGRRLPRNVVLGLGGLFLGLSAGLTGLTANFAQFTGLRFMAAVANAPQHPVGNSMIADRFPRERRGSALAVNYAGGNIGTLIVPLVAVAAIGAYGWQTTLWLFAIPGILVGLLLMVALDDRGRAVVAEARRGSMISQVTHVLRYPNVALLIGASSISAGGRGLGVLLTFIPLYLANEIGLPPAAVGALYTSMLVGSVLGPMGAGRLSDRLGRRTVLIATLLLSTAATGLMASVGAIAVPLLMVVLFLVGLFTFTESPLIQSFIADSVPAGQRDIIFGFYFAWTYGVGALWVALLGFTIDRAGFLPAWWIVAGSYLGALLLVLASRERAEVPD